MDPPTITIIRKSSFSKYRRNDRDDRTDQRPKRRRMHDSLWNRFLENCRIRNEIFVDKMDFRCVLFIVTALDTNTTWDLATLMAYTGYFCLVPIIANFFFMGIAMFVFTLYIGAFSGTGIGWTIRNALHIISGVAAVTTIQAFLLLLDETYQISALAVFTFRVLRSGGSWSRCDQKWTHGLWCTTVANASVACASLVHWENSENSSCTYGFLSRSPIQFMNHVMFNQQWSFDWSMCLGSLGLFAFLACLTFIAVRQLANYGKFLIFPSFFFLYLMLLTAGLVVRGKSSLGFWDLIDFMRRTSVPRDLKTWIQSFSILFQVHMIGQGVLIAICRRSLQGSSLLVESALNSIVSFWVLFICALVHLIAAPGIAFLHKRTGKDDYGAFSQEVFAAHPWVWLLLGYETVQELFTMLGVCLVLIFQIIRSVGKWIFVIDTIRIGIIEMIGYDHLRPLIAPTFLAVAFIFSIPRCFSSAWGFKLDSLMRYHLTLSFFRVIPFVTLLLGFGTFYGTKRIASDILIYVPIRVVKNRMFLHGLQYFTTTGVPIFLMAVGLTDYVLFMKDEDSFFILPQMTPFSRKTIHAIAWLIIMIIPGRAGWLIWKSVVCDRDWRLLFHPTEIWGPSETRYWVGPYKHLRLRHLVKLKQRERGPRKAVNIGRNPRRDRDRREIREDSQRLPLSHKTATSALLNFPEEG